jgi:aspartate-semialdehyde dehydrogenase
VRVPIVTGHSLSFNAEFNVPTCRSSAVFVRILGVLIIISVGPLRDQWRSEQGRGAQGGGDRRT